MNQSMGHKIWESSRMLDLGRAFWLLLALLSLGAAAASKVADFDEIRQICDPTSPCPSPPRMAADDAQALKEAGLGLSAYAAISIATSSAIYLSSWAVAMLIFLANPGKLWGLFMPFLLLYYGSIFGGPSEFFQESLPPAALWLMGALGMVSIAWGFTGFIVFLFIFPDGRFFPRWTRYVVPAAVILNLSEIFSQYDLFTRYGRFTEQFLAPLSFMLVLAGVLAQIYRYVKVSGPQQRRQTKWVLFGGVLSILLLIAAAIPTLLLNDSPGGLYDLLAPVISPLVFALLPISLGIAILRSQLWDIDIIIRKTVTYALLTAVLGFVYFGSVVLLQNLFSSVTGQESPAVLVLSTLLIAALFQPLRRRLKDVIDRRFYRRKYDAVRTMAAFGQTVRDEVDLERLTAELVQTVTETMQPQKAWLWLRPIELKVSNRTLHHAIKPTRTVGN